VKGECVFARVYSTPAKPAVDVAPAEPVAATTATASATKKKKQEKDILEALLRSEVKRYLKRYGLSFVLALSPGSAGPGEEFITVRNATRQPS
jgi:hypothetical protein